jgi:hypothetical protein
MQHLNELDELTSELELAMLNLSLITLKYLKVCELANIDPYSIDIDEFEAEDYLMKFENFIEDTDE